MTNWEQASPSIKKISSGVIQNDDVGIFKIIVSLICNSCCLQITLQMFHKTWFKIYYFHLKNTRRFR